MAAIVPWQPQESSREVIRHLAAGERVALPTEASYEIVASALSPDALPPNPGTALVLLEYADLADWMPRLRGAAARLLRKMGPGPVTIRANGGYASGLWSRLPAAAQRLVARDGLLTLRWPGQPIWSELRAAGLPLISTPLEGAFTAEAVAAPVACVIDGGPAQFAGGPTLVRAAGQRCEIERPGVLTQGQLDELAVCRILFICTGNTCRSPLAEALCRKMLAAQIGCSPAELSQHGFLVQSAGLAAMMGGAASAEGAVVAADLGVDLSAHRSRMVTMDMLLLADFVFGMTAGHCYTLESILAEGMTLPRLLSPRFEDIADPIGGALADYRTCATQIAACLQERLPELLES